MTEPPASDQTLDLPASAGANDLPGEVPSGTAGRNLLFGEIGHGGMGAVLRGRDPDLGRELAVKVLLEAHRHNPELIDRFIEEAQIAGQLQHPGVVPVYELGRFDDNRPFFTMKLVKGQTLATLLEQRTTPREELPRFLAYFQQVSQTVAYAHAHGVIHRDLKPTNVMIGSFGEVQVMDWGLAKVLPKAGTTGNEVPPSGRELTNIRTLPAEAAPAGERLGTLFGLGTYGYMPPEQALGEAAQIDERADVFALGAILCVILTGQLPFAGSAEEVKRQTAGGNLTAAFARLEASGADAALLGLCKECLAPDLKDRPRDASIVAKRMEDYQADVQARLRQAERERAAAQVKAGEERKRRRLAVALAAAVLALIVTGGSGWLWLARMEDARTAEVARQAAETEQGIRLALQEASTRPEQTRDLVDRPAEWKASLAGARAALKRAERLAEGITNEDLRQEVHEREKELEDEEKDRLMAERLAQLRLRGGALKFDFSIVAEASEAYERAFREYGLDFAKLETAAAVGRIKSSKIHATLAASLGDWLFVRNLTGKWQDSLAKQIVAVDVALTPEYWAFSGALNNAREKKDLARLRATVEVIVAQQAFRSWSPHRITGLAFLCQLAGAPGEAEYLLGKYQQSRPNDFWANWYLATHYLVLGVPSPGAAARHLHICQALRPDVPEVRLGLSEALLQNQEFEKALAVLQTAAEAQQATADIQLSLGACWQGLWEPEKAAGHYRHAIRLKPDFPEAYAKLGEVLESQGKYQEAVAHFRQALERENSSVTSQLQRQLKEHLTKVAGPDQKASHEIQTFLEPMIRQLTERMVGPADYYLQLGTTLVKQDKVNEAVEALRQAAALKPSSAMVAYHLTLAYLSQGELAMAEREVRRWESLGSGDEGLPFTLAQMKDYVKLVIELDGKLPKIRKGEENPGKDANRLLTLMQLCIYRNDPVATVKFYQLAVEADPAQVGNYRYSAACAALRAVAGRGTDARNLDDNQRTSLRLLATLWLSEEAVACQERLVAAAKQDLEARQQGKSRGASGVSSAAQVRLHLTQTMRHWQQAPDLAIVRGEEALAKLPLPEQKVLRTFWAGVESQLAMLQQIQAGK